MAIGPYSWVAEALGPNIETPAAKKTTRFEINGARKQRTIWGRGPVSIPAFSGDCIKIHRPSAKYGDIATFSPAPQI